MILLCTTLNDIHLYHIEASTLTCIYCLEISAISYNLNDVHLFRTHCLTSSALALSNHIEFASVFMST